MKDNIQQMIRSYISVLACNKREYFSVLSFEIQMLF